MALHILQPSLRPIGQFDLESDQTVTGGEIGVFTADTGTGTTAEDPAASDALTVGPYSAGDKLMVSLGAPGTSDSTADDSDAAELRFLLDEGTDGYGTLFGSAIGGTAGQGLTYGTTASGAVVAMGPASHFASGKVTCWHAPGLYAVSGTGATNLDNTVAVNTNLYAHGTSGLLQTTANGDAVALMVGNMFDDSLVSTSLAAAGGTAAITKHAIYFLGQR